MTVTPGPARSRLDPEPVPRRDFLGLASLASMAGTMLFALVGLLRLPKAAVLSSPARKFKVNLPESLPLGEPFIPPGRSVALFRDEQGVYAISTICTHLGCVVKAGKEGFACPCHGSRFAPDGAVVKGPAPTALPWVEVTGGGGQYVVNEDRRVQAGTRLNA